MTVQGKQIDLANWPVAVLAGGLSTRLRPLTEKTPKALLNVAGEPFVMHQLRLLHSQGFRKVVLCVGYLGEMIRITIGDGSEVGVDVRYSFDGPTLLGTGGALKHALPQLGQQFVVIYGDSYMPVDYRAIVQAFVLSRKPALMAILKNEGRWDASNVWFEDGELRRYDKTIHTAEMRHIDYGIAVLSAEVFAQFPDHAPFDLADVYSRLVSENQMAAYEVNERFYEIGSRQGLAELDSLLRNKSAAISR
jgi:N-acetyl-alpha-D-muramate 1-phosphate uridylyltransferase